nr:ribonuclease H-like domain, reverse transcriptase, RNA-dependent DNA polymerase [Tanacetum cinerariifolium]
VLVTKPHNKTPYKLLLGRTPSICLMRTFGCPVTILNTLDPLGKFDGKADEGFLVGYSVSRSGLTWLIDIDTLTKSMNYQPVTAGNQPNPSVGSGLTWLIDIDTLTKFMNYQPVTAGNQPNPSVGIQKHFDADKPGEGNVQQYVLFPLWSSGSKDSLNTDDDVTFEVKEPEFEVKEPESEVYFSPSSSAKTKKHDDKTKREAKGKSPIELSTRFRNLSEEFKDFSDNSINEVNATSTPVPTVGQISTNSTNIFSAAGPSNTIVCPTRGKSSYVDHSQYLDDPNMPALKDVTYSDDEEDVGAEGDFSNLETSIIVSPIPITRVHKDHPVTQIINDLSSAPQTWSMIRMVKEQGGLTQINHEDFYTLDLPKGKRAIGLKWVFRNKKNERGIVIRNKARLVAQGHTQKKVIDYEEVFSLVARIEAIRLFLAYASFMGFMVYQMDVTSSFFYGTIKEEVYVCHSSGFEDLDYPDKVYVNDIIFGSTNKDLCKAFEKLMKDKFQMSSMGELTFFLGLQVKQKPDGIFISQDKYVAEILRKFGLTDKKSASTPIDTEKPLLKDPDGKDVDVHTYRSMIGFLMYLTSSRPDIMFAVCACARFQVTSKASHLHAVKGIFSDYTGASLDKKSTTGGCQFFGCRLISWQCKKQSVVATSSTEAEYVAATSCCAQVLWIKNQLLDYRRKVIITEDTLHQALRLDDAEIADDVITDDVADVVAHAAAEPTQPSSTPTTTPPPPSQELPSTSQVAPTLPLSPHQSPQQQPSSPPQQPQPSHTTTISMELLNNLLETCIALTRRVKNLEQDKIAQALEITKLKQRVMRLEKKNKLKGRLEESQAQVYHIDLEHADKVLSMQDDAPVELKEVIEVVTTAKLMTEVVTVAATTITAAPITSAIITAAPSAARSRKGVVIRDPEKTATPSTIVHSEPKAKDKGKDILVKRKEKEDNVVLRYQALKRKPQTEAHARKNMMVYLKNMAGFKMDFFKGMSYDDIRPIFEKYINSNVAFLEKSEKELEEEASMAIKRKCKSSEEKAAKKQKLDEEKNQRGIHGLAKVKSWKLLESCGIHIITFTTTQMILLVERSFGVDVVKDFKEYTLRDYYCSLKTYYCWYKLKLLDNAADLRLRLLEQSADVDEKMKK